MLFGGSDFIIDTMKTIKNLVEYYDELFPVTETKKKFYADFSRNSITPIHYLSIDCGTGFLESSLARDGHDVTGVENVEELLESANLRRRNQLMSIRFFQMEKQDMVKFLGKSFYNVISILNSRLMFLSNADALGNFFCDCRKLLAEDGCLVIEQDNFENHETDHLFQLPRRESVRSKLFSEVILGDDGKRTLSVNLENSSDKILSVIKDVPVYPVTPSEIEHFAEEAGFSSAEFYADFDRSEFTGNEEKFVVIIK